VAVEEVEDARIERPTDVLVKITSTNICGSDLHMYEGRTSMEQGRVLGHENLGEVIEVGAAVLRVPYGDFNCLRLPPDAAERELDYVMLADIWPTGYHATELADVQPGDSVVIYGAGPVGLMAAYSANLRGASRVMVVDRHPDRLALVDKIGAVPIDDSQADAVEQVLDLTGAEGADKGCECVGWQAHDPQGTCLDPRRRGMGRDPRRRAGACREGHRRHRYRDRIQPDLHGDGPPDR
jgi:glutathione-independent formaldehyde dehydrogenase